MDVNCELTLEKEMGRLRRVTDNRGGVSCRSPGDKSYKRPEYSRGFFNDVKYNGNILSNASLGNVYSTTLLSHSWQVNAAKSRDQQKKKNIFDDIQAVIDLDKWKPAKKLSRKLKCIHSI